MGDGNDHHGLIVPDSVDQDVWEAGDTQLAVLASDEWIGIWSGCDAIGGTFYHQTKASSGVCVASAIPRLGGSYLFLGQAMEEQLGHEC